ncbi:PE-PGRS family protein [Streptomyces sp. NPDC048417]|uniref:PE-PGRS family protein n=1 Tax=Streptomyces sp. NPDC048417 TaxID=3155387 RepID=UPI00342F8B0B
MGRREELVALLGRAGLELAGEPCVEDVVPPPVAWRHVITMGARPTVEVALDLPDAVAELNAQWHRLVSGAGLLDGDGVFLVDFQGNPRRGWIRVRLTDGWDLAGVLGERSGQPEFVTLSLDGDALVGATTEEYTVWLVAVDRIRERQEERARAAAAETEEDRAAAWEGLFRGPGPTEKLLDAWARGLSYNRAFPKDLRPLLLERSHVARYGAMPEDVVDAMLAHPDWKIRSHAAEVQLNITPEQWVRVIEGEREERYRWVLTLIAADRQAELPEGTRRGLAADPSARVRREAVRLKDLPTAVLVALATTDPDGEVRAAACPVAWPRLDAAARAALLADPDGTVRERAQVLHHRDHPMPRSVYESRRPKTEVLESCRLERGLAEHLVRHGEPDERSSLARNPRLDPDLVALLAEDPDARVRWEVSIRGDLTEEQREAVLIDFHPESRHHALPWVVALHDDHEAMRRLAASSHPLVRRSVARARHLPPDVVARLTDDEDQVVQLFLAESCDDAPADMLLRVWQWWTGSMSVPDRPRGHPNFPRHDLLRHADDPSPRMRRLALDDPESTPGLVERLSRDPSEEVRYRAATDPRLSAVAAARLLEDPHQNIRHAATRHPHLPVRLLTRLLRQHDTAEEAAGNPALPVEVMRRMAAALGADGGTAAPVTA